MSEKYKNLKVKELQELLQKHDLPHSGKKEELIERLVKFDEEQGQNDNLDEFEDLLGENEESDKPIDLNAAIEEFDSLEEKSIPTTEKPAAETKEKEQKETTPVTKPNSSFKFTPITFEKKAETTSTTTTTTTTTTTATVTTEATPKTKDPIIGKSAGNTDAEKALERAKRFGVQLNDSAKKDIRAQRFGLNKGGNDSEASKKRAERFGTDKPKATGLDPEVLKKRAERFGLNKTGNVSVTLDAAEEEKKRKRAERFNQDANKKTKA